MLWLLKLINPIKAVTEELVRWKVAQQNAETEQKRIEADENIKALEVQRDILVSDQSNWLTRCVRPLWAAPGIIYTWKVIVWDKVVKGNWSEGVTDPLGTELWGLVMLIAGSYFVFRGSEKLLDKLTRR